MNSNGKRLFVARHGETVFNAAGRLQGTSLHTPLTVAGFRQALAMGEGLAHYLGGWSAPLDLTASDTGRALQTLALIAEAIGCDWQEAISDARLNEIDVGGWGGVYYRDLMADGPVIHAEHRLFMRLPEDAESYTAIAVRLRGWIAEQGFARDMLIVSHGMTSRVLRGLLCGLPDLDGFGAPIAPGLPQGSMVAIRDGVEEVIVLGGGEGEKG
ncbi:histidine phosphatase family protein [Novosphingopyxis sp.]|uniref:histidine phosphatase family protein n=1 Tax=Novosphingopyxis sp. TaxID=2709690 RepID=UPI003B5B3D58